MCVRVRGAGGAAREGAAAGPAAAEPAPSSIVCDPPAAAAQQRRFCSVSRPPPARQPACPLGPGGRGPAGGGPGSPRGAGGAAGAPLPPGTPLPGRPARPGPARPRPPAPGPRVSAAAQPPAPAPRVRSRAGPAGEGRRPGGAARGAGGSAESRLPGALPSELRPRLLPHPARVTRPQLTPAGQSLRWSRHVAQRAASPARRPGVLCPSFESSPKRGRENSSESAFLVSSRSPAASPSPRSGRGAVVCESTQMKTCFVSFLKRASSLGCAFLSDWVSCLEKSRCSLRLLFLGLVRLDWFRCYVGAL